MGLHRFHDRGRTHGNYGSSFVFWDYLCGTHIAPGGEGRNGAKRK